MTLSETGMKLLLRFLLVCCLFSLSVLPACAGEFEPFWQVSVKQKTLFNSYTAMLPTAALPGGNFNLLQKMSLKEWEKAMGF